jgi:hypothetical protein
MKCPVVLISPVCASVFFSACLKLRIYEKKISHIVVDMEISDGEVLHIRSIFW